MKIAVLGGCGYIGSAIYQHLAEQGHELLSIDMELRGNPGVDNLKMNYVHALTRYDNFDAVIVMAGVSSVAGAIENPQRAFLYNVEALFDLARLHLNGQPLIYASSAAVLAPRTGPTNMYDASKRVIEEMLPLLYPNSWGLRFGTVSGPSPNTRWDTMVNAMVRSAVRHGVVHVGNPTIWRPILAMSDLLVGLDAILAGDVKPGVHNCMSFNTTPIGMASLVADLTGARISELPPSSAYDFVMMPSEGYPVGRAMPEDVIRAVAGTIRVGSAAE